MTTEKVLNIPGNFITHRPSWREALVIAKEHAKTEADASYWQHEINAFDRSFDRLWELMRTSPTAEQQIKKPNVVLELPDGDDRVAKVFFSEMKGDTLHLCITVTEQAAPKAATGPLNDDE